MAKEPITKKQHTIPRAYLALFAGDECLPALRMSDGYAFTTSPQDACTRRYYYETEYSDATPGKDPVADRFVNPNAIENGMSAHESVFIQAIRIVCSSCAGVSLSEAEIVKATDSVFDFAMHLVSRNPRALPDLVGIAKEGLGDYLYAKAKTDADRINRPDEVEAIAAEHAKQFILNDSRFGLLSRKTYYEWRSSRRLIIKASGDKSFITSDFPVCGQGAYGIPDALFLPLSSRVAIMFYGRDSAKARCEYGLIESDAIDMINAMQMSALPKRDYLYGADCAYLSWLHKAVSAGNLSFPNLIFLTRV